MDSDSDSVLSDPPVPPACNEKLLKKPVVRFSAAQKRSLNAFYQQGMTSPTKKSLIKLLTLS